MSRGRRVSTLLAPLCLVTATLGLPAQSERDRQLGLAVRADGSPWAAARVEFRSPIPDPDLPPLEVDEVVVTTDSRGRFVADVLRGRRYLVFATAEAGDGAITTSGVVRAETAPVLCLRARPGVRAATHFEFGDLAARVREVSLFEREIGRFSRLPVVDGAVSIPAGPSSSADLAAFGSDDELLLRGVVPLDGATHALRSPPSRVRRVRVVDEDEHEPVADAVIGCVDLGRILPLCLTGADGIASIDLARIGLRVDGIDRRRIDAGEWLTVEHRDHRLGVLSFDDAADDPADSETTITAECELLAPDGESPVMRFCFGGRPLDGLMVSCPRHGESQMSGGGTASEVFSRTLRLEPDGVLRFVDTYLDEFYFRVSVGPRAARALPDAWRANLGQGLMLRFAMELFPPRTADGVRPVREFDLRDEFRLVRFDLTSSNHGGPVSGARVFVGTKRELGFAPLLTDAVGQAHALVPMRVDDPVYAVVCTEEGYAAVQVQRHRLLRHRERSTQVRLDLKAVAVLDLEVTDTRGDPLDHDLMVSVSQPNPAALDDTPGDPLDDEGVFTTCSPSMTAALVSRVTLVPTLAHSRVRVPVPTLGGDWSVVLADLRDDSSAVVSIGPELEPRVYEFAIDLQR